MPSATPDRLIRAPAAVDVAVAVAASIGRPLGPDEPIAVAVSGGSDSLALLLLAHAAFGDRVRVLTVDHQLRAAGAAEAAAVAAHAAALGVPHATLPWLDDKPAANLQAAARTARYTLMRDWCAANGVVWLATAHHRDDQAETLLLRLARGAGTGGLGGIRARRGLGSGVTLLRPQLAASKADLAAIVAAAGWTAADDPSNAAPRFDRTHARALLAATPWLAPHRLAASAAHLADAEATLTWAADLAWRSRVEATGTVIVVDAGGLPHDLARRLIVRAVATLDAAAVVRGGGVERLLRHLTAGRGGTLARVAARPLTRDGVTFWTFRRAPERRDPPGAAAGRR